MSCVELEVQSPIMVDAQIKRWTITNDNIYLLKFHEKPPDWLEDIINDVIEDTGLIEDLDDLEDRFGNFEEGYTEHFYDWKDGDTETLAYVETMYTTNAVFNAGVQEIKVAYVSKNESGAYFDQLIGAWQTGAGGAWFNERVSVVSNVAYSAARSASTLTASIRSQQDNINAIIGDIENLEKQIDGKVETWFDTHEVVNNDGTIIETAEPYATWLANGTLAEHTGDTYILYELDANNKEQILATYRFGKDPNNNEIYNWFTFTDDLATKAYEQALEAGYLADKKINTYYQTYPPTSLEDETLGAGDIWLDSDDNNKMYRYDGAQWIQVADKNIQASVDRLDQATVTVDGLAVAKSSLVVDADGYISGYRASSTNNPNDPGSLFQIFADRFYISGSPETGFSRAPFSIETSPYGPANIKFNGLVEFSNVEGNEDILKKGDAASDINQHTTTIDGGKITTYSLNANRIAADTIWSRGMIQSADYSGYSSGYVGNDNPTGFMLNAKAGSGSYNYPNIYGSYIRGGHIHASEMSASIIEYNGAKYRGLGYNNYKGGLGKQTYMESIDFVPGTSSSIVLVGNVYGVTAGSNADIYDARRILSFWDSYGLVTVNYAGTAYEGTNTVSLQIWTNDKTWRTVKSKNIWTTGGETLWDTSLQWKINFWEIGDYNGLSRFTGYIIFRVVTTGNIENASGTMVVTLNN